MELHEIGIHNIDQLKKDELVQLRTYKLLFKQSREENVNLKEAINNSVEYLQEGIVLNDWSAIKKGYKILGKYTVNEITDNNDYRLRELKIGDYVKCMQSNAKNLTVGKKYILIDAFISDINNKWRGKIKADNSCKIWVKETRRFAKG